MKTIIDFLNAVHWAWFDTVMHGKGLTGLNMVTIADSMIYEGRW